MTSLVHLIGPCLPRSLQPRRAAPSPLRKPRRKPPPVVVAAILLCALGSLPGARGQGVEDPTRPFLQLNLPGHTASVKALAFVSEPQGESQFLCSGGLDKVVQVWNMAKARDIGISPLRAGALLHERTIRWQVGRGPRGSIFALAASPRQRLLALAGYGAMGGTGEILLVDPVTGELQAVLQGHTQAVTALAFAADGTMLASSDADGRTLLWHRQDGAWQSRQIYPPDRENRAYGPALAERIRALPVVRPVAVLGNEAVLLPVVNTQRVREGRPLIWHLQRVSIANFREHDTLPAEHTGQVLALAVSGDGRRVASADAMGQIWLWADGLSRPPRRISAGARVASLALTPDGSRLLVGTQAARDASGRLLVYQAGTGEELAQREIGPDHVAALAVDRAGRRVACTGGEHHGVLLLDVDDLQRPMPLRGVGSQIWRVAFADDPASYRVAFGISHRGQDAAFNRYGEVAEAFDPAALALGEAQGEWIDPESGAGAWEARLEPPAAGLPSTLRLYQRGQLRGEVPLDPAIDGRVRSYCWIPGDGPDPVAVAVGTDRQHAIYVYALDPAGPSLLRAFRGHHDWVTSLSVSRDGKYLASGSVDGTIRFWSLSRLLQGTAARWGATLVAREGRLIVTELDPAGPLFRMGVRADDVLLRIGFLDAQGQVRHQDQPAAILRTLREISWQRGQVTFFFERGGQPRPPFQSLPAWQPLASLFPTRTGEWAFFTPEGYYAASLNGHTFFGWQVNRGLDTLPDFFRADQFRRQLERPAVMQDLLALGSLHAALGAHPQAAQTDEPQQAVDQLVSRVPRVQITQPPAGSLVAGELLRVQARVLVPLGTQLDQPRLFANGVAATSPRQISRVQTPAGEELLYEWDAALPADRAALLHASVPTLDGPTGLDVIRLERGPDVQPAPGRLFLLAVGVSRYHDPELELEFPVADAQAVAEALSQRCVGLYQMQPPVLLADEDVTRENWQRVFQQFVAELKRAELGPHDLVVVFLAGHGFYDEREERFYLVARDVARSDLAEGRFEKCIPWSDLHALADLTCRKLAMVDACESGMVLPGIRSLQDDMVLTLTAAADNKPSLEHESWGHGAFTKALLEAIAEGQADASQDRLVSLAETVGYVQSRVPELTLQQSSIAQRPQFAPEALLDVTSLPLAIVP